jgi:hypothetical protein
MGKDHVTPSTPGQWQCQGDSSFYHQQDIIRKLLACSMAMSSRFKGLERPFGPEYGVTAGSFRLVEKLTSFFASEHRKTFDTELQLCRKD